MPERPDPDPDDAGAGTAGGRPSPAAIAAAGEALAAAWERFDSMTPAEAARAAYMPGGPSVEELEARIRELRGLPEAGSTTPEEPLI